MRIPRPKAATAMFFVGLALIGALAGVIWERVVVLPTVTIREDWKAIPTSEATLTTWFAADSWFSILGIITGLFAGVWAWVWFNKRGWVVTVYAIAGSLLAGFVCLRVGEALGPKPFNERLAAASLGDVVEIGFELQSMAAFLLWAFAAITPVMLCAAFAPDTETKPTQNA